MNFFDKYSKNHQYKFTGIDNPPKEVKLGDLVKMKSGVIGMIIGITYRTFGPQTLEIQLNNERTDPPYFNSDDLLFDRVLTEDEKQQYLKELEKQSEQTSSTVPSSETAS